jgi:hypothetical protein
MSVNTYSFFKLNNFHKLRASPKVCQIGLASLIFAKMLKISLQQFDKGLGNFWQLEKKTASNAQRYTRVLGLASAFLS